MLNSGVFLIILQTLTFPNGCTLCNSAITACAGSCKNSFRISRNE